MRHAIISDPQGNVEALRAVLRLIRRDGIRKVFCLGDLVGGCAFPLETLALLRAGGTHPVLGSQDLMVLGRLEPDAWEPRTRRAISWTRQALTGEELEYLAGLPSQARLGTDLLFVHSTLRNPARELRSSWQFYEESLYIRHRFPEVRICFTGRLRRQQIVEITAAGEVFSRGSRQLVLRKDSFFFVNPGSVGCPAEADYRAAFAVYDDATRRVTFRRATYDRLRVTQENIRHGLSDTLGVQQAGYFRSRAAAAARSIRTRILAGIP